MGFDFIVETEETEDAVNINLVGTDSASIIGYRGEVLDSIQYLTSLVCNKNKDSYKRLTVDTENYREKRAETLRNLAKNLENKVKTYRQNSKTRTYEPLRKTYHPFRPSGQYYRHYGKRRRQPQPVCHYRPEKSGTRKIKIF